MSTHKICWENIPELSTYPSHLFLLVKLSLNHVCYNAFNGQCNCVKKKQVYGQNISTTVHVFNFKPFITDVIFFFGKLDRCKADKRHKM